MKRITAPLLGLAVSGLLLLPLEWSLRAQEKQPAATTENFTGNAQRLQSNIHVRAARIHFDPGARTKWHIHQKGQILMCEEGVMRTQMQGHPVQELHPGETTYVPGGVPHWHGASPTRDATIFSVDVSAGQSKWLGPVSDAEYRAALKR